MVYTKFKDWTYRLLEPEKGEPLGRYVDLAIMGLILLSVAAIILETVDPIAEAYGTELHYFELFCIGVFTIEYLGRVWSITSSEKYRNPRIRSISIC